jgi:hypothetical protein
MDIPTTPVSGASVASVWGQAVHYASFTPAGASVQGDPVTMLSAQAYRDVDISNPVSDPGTWYDAGNNRLLAPDDAAGIYIVHAELVSDGGATTGATGVVLRQNTTERARVQADNEGSTDVGLSLSAILTIADGDTISLRARNIGTGTLPTVYLRLLTLVRVGAEFGIAL